MNLTTAGRRLRTVLETIATLLVIVIGAVLLYRILQGPPSRTARSPVRSAAAAPAPLPTEPLSIEGAAARGGRNAKVAVIEYSEFQCPYCGQFARETLPKLDKRYFETGRVIFAFRHFPLERIHPFALKAGESVECAGRQGKFWEMHDRLFRNQKDLGESALNAHAKILNLNMGEFARCLQGQFTDKIRSDLSGGNGLAVSGTPTFFIGLIDGDGRVKVVERMVGAQPAEQFGKVLDALLGADQK